MTTAAVPAIEDGSTPSFADRFVPSIPAIIFICLSIFVPLMAQPRLINGDGDLARHLRHGMYMLEHHSLIWRDPFSFTRAGQPFVPFEYGSQLIYALVYRIAGLAGVTIFAGLLIATTYALMARVLLRHQVDALLVLVTTGAAVLLGYHHWLARPHLLSWVAIVALFGLLESRRRPALWIYPLFFALWANIHGGWLYGIALLGIYFAGNLVEYRVFDRSAEQWAATRHFAIALPIALIATLATPMSFRLWSHLYTHLGDSYVIDHTSEFESPDFHSLSSKILLFIVLGALAALVMNRRRMQPAHFLVVFAGAWCSLTAARNLPLLGLTGLAAVALHIDADWRRLPGGWFTQWRSAVARGAASASGSAWIVLCTGVLAYVGFGNGKLFGRRILANEFDANSFPVAAVTRARECHLEGRLYSDFAWGGYILFAWPEQRVFIDGGTDFYGADVMRDAVALSSLDPGWRSVLNRRRVELVLTSVDSRLARELPHTPGWAVWYRDSVAVIMQRIPGVAAEHRPSSQEVLETCADLRAEGIARLPFATHPVLARGGYRAPRAP